jgi:hypothetical protein
VGGEGGREIGCLGKVRSAKFGGAAHSLDNFHCVRRSVGPKVSTKNWFSSPIPFFSCS